MTGSSRLLNQVDGKTDHSQVDGDVGDVEHRKVDRHSAEIAT